MAACKWCEAEVSDTAALCSACGKNPKVGPSERTARRVLAAVVLAAALIIGGLYWADRNEKSTADRNAHDLLCEVDPSTC